MLRTRRQKAVIWTCLLALWLSMFMPAISQTLMARGSAGVFDQICTSSGLVHLDANEGHKPSMPMADHSNACGYCTLFANSPPVISTFELVIPTVAIVLHDSPLLYEYLPPRPFRGQTNPLDPPLTLS
ncbi:DUF2946 domain-containing protein [Glaciimonas sp. PCH181]|uniref:DUF2946 domain-containing protein n=1 Tax=Glaciimonas sp. PCH181 TaxID=2133943 RepID=UPI000D399FC9|nr:DUF2946 domain-containing protein [Glaciimonas sp. PCH181]PUA17789.1 hypothetical protein C7W93_18170 [Glaciimonas sp. PCH181]